MNIIETEVSVALASVGQISKYANARFISILNLLIIISTS